MTKGLELKWAYKESKRGFILDGVPRTLQQAVALDELFSLSGDSVTHLLELRIPDERLFERIKDRWVHRASGLNT